MPETPDIFSTQRVTLNVVPGLCTEIVVPSSATTLLIRPEGTDAKIDFASVEGAPLGADHLTITADTITYVPLGKPSVFIAAAGISVVVQYLFVN
jgi:hypothetical protein